MVYSDNTIIPFGVYQTERKKRGGDSGCYIIHLQHFYPASGKGPKGRRNGSAGIAVSNTRRDYPGFASVSTQPLFNVAVAVAPPALFGRGHNHNNKPHCCSCWKMANGKTKYQIPSAVPVRFASTLKSSAKFVDHFLLENHCCCRPWCKPKMDTNWIIHWHLMVLRSSVSWWKSRLHTNPEKRIRFHENVKMG